MSHGASSNDKWLTGRVRIATLLRDDALVERITGYHADEDN
jgi:hypothetical protein